MSFDELALVCERVAATPSRNRKISLLGEYLTKQNETDLVRATRFLCGQPLPGGAKMSLGHAALREALIEVTGWDLETVRLCYREVGDTGETIGLLLQGATRNLPLTLQQAEEEYLGVFGRKRTADRVARLAEVFLRYSPLSLKYFVKGITGNLRIGLQERLVEEAIAAATGHTAAALREASHKAGQLGDIARAAYRRELHLVEAKIFHPMEFMLAKPIEQAPELGDAADWWVEDKYDGIRSQVHAGDGQVKIYSRGMEEVTAAFPEIVTIFAGLPVPIAIDGELLAWRDGKALNFTVLQQRLQRKTVPAELLTEVPIIFMAYDLLHLAGQSTAGLTLEERLHLLAQHLPDGARLSARRPLAELPSLEEEFNAARKRGNEGLLLKRRGTIYEPGKRGNYWLKVKKAFGTLDVVVTAAEQGHGRRATMLSDYTFAVRDGDRFLNVGKAYSGLTDDEIRELTRVLRGLTQEKYGRVMLVRPEVVLEVAFDGIQKSPRHKSGFALRFPRILRWRQDKSPADADTLAAVQALYTATLG
ncbi:MAG: ATP-dependent DNA ligase [Bryobacteraceae bacterium]|nr:ATP-dependent DNA ligase [Bryobacteraceae bacterium]